MNKEQLIEYFMNDFVESQFTSRDQYYNNLQKKETEVLRLLHSREEARKENKKRLYNEGSDAYKIEYSQEDRMEILIHMRDNGMLVYNEDNGFTSYFLDYGTIMYYVPEIFVQELEKHFNIKRLGSIHILGKEELPNFKAGDKVKITINNWYGKIVEQGTVNAIKNDEIIVRKYRTRKQGFVFKAGKECNMVKIEAFDKMS